MTVDNDILDYLTQEIYEEAIKNIKNNQSKKIYEDEKTIIKVMKRGRRTYTFIDKFGKEKLDTALNNICSLVV